MIRVSNYYKFVQGIRQEREHKEKKRIHQLLTNIMHVNTTIKDQELLMMRTKIY